MQDLTTGSISKHLLRTTGMMLVGMVMQTLYVLVDLYWVGHISTEAIAAAGVAGNLTFVVLAASQALGVGTTSLIAQAVGRKDHHEAVHVYGQSQLLAFISGAAFWGLAALLQDAYVDGLTPDPATAALAHDFLRWFVPAMALQFPMVALGSAMRGTGRFAPGMIVHAGSVALNMILSPILMFGWIGPPMGIAGAALGTFLAVLAATIGMVCYFLPQTAYLRFTAVRWKPDVSRWRAILTIGVPAGAEFAFLAVWVMVVYAVTRRFGASAQAGFGIGMRVLQSGFMPVVALGFAVGPVAGQNFGAGHFHRVRATFYDAVSMGGGIMLLFALVVHFVPEPLLRPFSSDPAVLASAATYLRIVSWSFVASGVIYVVSSLFQAMGNTVPPLIASATRTVVTIGGVLILSTWAGFSMEWIWWLSVGSIGLQLSISLLLLRRAFAAHGIATTD
jgi:putative MATE family efflux protein